MTAGRASASEEERVLGLVGERFAELTAYTTRPEPAPVRLDANESPWPLSREARRAFLDVMAGAALNRYPDLFATRLRSALARRLGAQRSEVVCGVGSDEVIGLLMGVLDRPRLGAPQAVVLYPSPGFTMYGLTARVRGLAPVEVPLADDFTLDVRAMCRAIEEHRPNLIFIASPNNPTGNAFSDDDLRAVVLAAPDALVVLDEAYAPFAGRSLSAWVDEHPNVAVLGTLSKVGLAGLRVGWVRVRPSLASELEKARPPYNMATPSQEAAAVLLDDHADALDEAVRAIVEERERLASALSQRGLRVYPSDANFLLIEVGDAAAVHSRLLEAGVQVRRFARIERLSRHLRVTVGTSEDTAAFLSALDLCT